MRGKGNRGALNEAELLTFLLPPRAQMDFFNLGLRPCHGFPTGSTTLGAEPSPGMSRYPATLQ